MTTGEPAGPASSPARASSPAHASSPAPMDESDDALDNSGMDLGEFTDDEAVLSMAEDVVTKALAANGNQWSPSNQAASPSNQAVTSVTNPSPSNQARVDLRKPRSVSDSEKSPVSKSVTMQPLPSDLAEGQSEVMADEVAPGDGKEIELIDEEGTAITVTREELSTFLSQLSASQVVTETPEGSSPGGSTEPGQEEVGEKVEGGEDAEETVEDDLVEEGEDEEERDDGQERLEKNVDNGKFVVNVNLLLRMFQDMSVCVSWRLVLYRSLLMLHRCYMISIVYD